MVTDAFEHFRKELSGLQLAVSKVQGKTLRENPLRERFRDLFRVWLTVVRPGLSAFAKNSRELLKLHAEVEALAGLTSKNRRIVEYEKRLGRCAEFSGHIVLLLPPTPEMQSRVLGTGKDGLFVEGIPDLPVRLVPNNLIGWRSNIESFVREHPFDRSIFLMVRYRQRNANLIAAVKALARKDGFFAVVASDHRITDDLYNPIACLLACAKGLAVFDRGENSQEFNPNVAYELGMMHLLGRDLRILKHKTLRTLHTDILMKLYSEYGSLQDATGVIDQWLAGTVEKPKITSP